MPNYQQTLVSSLEYEALLNQDRMIRLAMSAPNTGQFLVTAIEALDTVRRDQGLSIPEAVTPQVAEKSVIVSDLASGLIRRAMRTGDES